MAVAKKVKAATAEVIKTGAVEPAPAPAPAPQPVKEAVAPAGPLAYIRLVNGCSTYVTPEREVFYAREPNTAAPRIYEVSIKDLPRLLAYKDDYNRKFFRQVTAPEDGVASAPEDVRNAKMEEKPTLVRPDADFHEEGGELDTGAMRLQDEGGNTVGVAV